MSKPKISIIVAMDKDRGIGKSNGLLWHIPEELKRFREITTGHPIIMGRKTYESIGKPLPNRTNIVITRDPSFLDSHPQLVSGSIIVVDSLEKAIEEAKKTMDPGSRMSGMTDEVDDKNEIFIIGGGQIYQQAMEKDLVDKLYVTIVSIDPSSQAPQDDSRGGLRVGFEPTVFFPEYESKFLKKVFESEIETKGQKDRNPQTFKVRFLELEK